MQNPSLGGALGLANNSKLDIATWVITLHLKTATSVVNSVAAMHACLPQCVPMQSVHKLNKHNVWSNEGMSRDSCVVTTTGTLPGDCYGRSTIVCHLIKVSHYKNTLCRI